MLEAEQELQRAKSSAATQRAEEQKMKAAAKATQAAAQLEAIKSKLQPSIDAADREIQAANAADSAKAAAVKAAREAKLKLHLHQLENTTALRASGFEPVLDMPVTIRDPDRPIGTHIFTAVSYSNGGTDIRWNVVSIGP